MPVAFPRGKFPSNKYVRDACFPAVTVGCVGPNFSFPAISSVSTDELDNDRTAEMERSDFFEVSVASRSGCVSELTAINQYVRSIISFGIVSVVAAGRAT